MDAGRGRAGEVGGTGWRDQLTEGVVPRVGRHLCAPFGGHGIVLAVSRLFACGGGVYPHQTVSRANDRASVCNGVPTEWG